MKKRVKTEEAIKNAVKLWKKNETAMQWQIVHDIKLNELYILAIDSKQEVLAEAPLKWLYTKRAPLTGITKRLKKAVRGKK